MAAGLVRYQEGGFLHETKVQGRGGLHPGSTGPPEGPWHGGHLLCRVWKAVQEFKPGRDELSPRVVFLKDHFGCCERTMSYPVLEVLRVIYIVG